MKLLSSNAVGVNLIRNCYYWSRSMETKKKDKEKNKWSQMPLTCQLGSKFCGQVSQTNINSCWIRFWKWRAWTFERNCTVELWQQGHQFFTINNVEKLRTYLDVRKPKISLPENRQRIDTYDQAVAIRVTVESTPQTRTSSDGEAVIREKERREVLF